MWNVTLADSGVSPAGRPAPRARDMPSARAPAVHSPSHPVAAEAAPADLLVVVSNALGRAEYPLLREHASAFLDLWRDLDPVRRRGQPIDGDATVERLRRAVPTWPAEMVRHVLATRANDDFDVRRRMQPVAVTPRPAVPSPSEPTSLLASVARAVGFREVRENTPLTYGGIEAVADCTGDGVHFLFVDMRDAEAAGRFYRMQAAARNEGANVVLLPAGADEAVIREILAAHRPRDGLVGRIVRFLRS
jgi:hypothetical protein